MPDYEFSLRFDTARVDCTSDECLDRLAEAGCTDAVIGIGVTGRLALDFLREAECAESAILSAIDDVLSALPEARLIEAAPDYVGYTEVAELVGRSRQNMRKLLLSANKPGPIPVHEGAYALWHLSPVLKWLRDERGYAISAELIDIADVTMMVNLAVAEANFGDARPGKLAGLVRRSARWRATPAATNA